MAQLAATSARRLPGGSGPIAPSDTSGHLEQRGAALGSGAFCFRMRICRARSRYRHSGSVLRCAGWIGGS